MAFLIRNREDIRSGAYALAYLIWINKLERTPEGGSLNKADDAGFVDTLNTEIQDELDSGSKNSFQFGNPIKMINSIKKYLPGCTVTLESSNSLFIKYYRRVLAPIVRQKRLRSLEEGEYAILMVNSIEEGEQTKYILIEGTNNGVNIINSIDGERKHIDCDMADLMYDGQYFKYINCQTAIYISH